MATTNLVFLWSKAGIILPCISFKFILDKNFIENPEKNRHVLHLKILLHSICGKTLRICIYTLAKWLTVKHNCVKVFELCKLEKKGRETNCLRWLYYI